MSKEGLLILGLGNPLMGDDGAGIHIINELKRSDLPDHVDIMDGGNAGIDLIDILSGRKRIIVIDAIKGDCLSGITLFSPDETIFKEEGKVYSMHDMEFISVLRLMKTLKMDIPDITIIGIPAASIAPGAGLTDKCSRFIPEAIELTRELLCQKGRGGATHY